MRLRTIEPSSGLIAIVFGVLMSVTLSARADDHRQSEDADAEEKQYQYIRIVRNDRKLASLLQTSVIRFAKSRQFPGRVVDLIGAIHLGEAAYYEELNRRFEDYDALLYEAVIPENALRQGLRPGNRRSGRKLTDDESWSESRVGLATISALQVGMKDVLGLEFQLAAVDYRPGNFVHADMTQEEMERSMVRRGESFSEMLAREMARATLQQQRRNPLAMNLDIVLSVLSSDRQYRVRRIAAVEMVRASNGDVFADSDGTSTIITERNIKALQVLRRELKKRSNKVLGLFYGAGHFDDMEDRMVSEFGFERVSEDWITAWQLRPPRSASDQNSR
ncbi:MAG: zinc ribbon domain-containing protein [Fuerstiella sp.]|nr:zinc ribbon domain-containing protein [Fuerstiella sp.]